MISVAVSLRSSRGLSVISIRPLLSAEFTPSTPMNEERLATSGSLRIASASACCRRAISLKEMSWAAVVMPWIAPVSWSGKKPFGISTILETGRRQGQNRDDQDQSLVIEHPAEPAVVGVDDGLKSAFGRPPDPAPPFARSRAA